MRITIVTACFNSADTIEDTLKSVAEQDYYDIEHIIIDGGSTDNTLEIVQRFPHVHTIISEKDGGIYYGMNKGLELASGDVIAFLNSDDWYHRRDVISQVAHVMRLHMDIGVVYGDLQYVDRIHTNKIARTWKSGNYKRKKIFYGWMPPHPTFFARASAYKAAGNYNTGLRNAADYELMLRILLKHEINAYYLPMIMVKMRRGGFSNAKLRHRLRANKEDNNAWNINGLKPKFFTRYMKPLRKIPQFFIHKIREKLPLAAQAKATTTKIRIIEPISTQHIAISKAAEG